MYKKITVIIVFISILFLSGCSEIERILDDEVIENQIYNNEETEEESLEVLSTTEESDWGSASALQSVDISIEEMLIYAIQDEFTAKSEYAYIIEKFDTDKPFSNIMKSEDTHIELLLPLFETYGYVVPEDNSSEHLFDIDSLQEAYAIGVTAEINNIDMYELFLTYELPQDIEDTFIKLRDASINHLDAFQKNLDRVS